jgi:hypothetical protein
MIRGRKLCQAQPRVFGSAATEREILCLVYFLKFFFVCNYGPCRGSAQIGSGNLFARQNALPRVLCFFSLVVNDWRDPYT